MTPDYHALQAERAADWHGWTPPGLRSLSAIGLNPCPRRLAGRQHQGLPRCLCHRYYCREVMRLIARGYAYKEVARELVISIKTVETHISSVLRKLQLSCRHELTRRAAAWSDLRGTGQRSAPRATATTSSSTSDRAVALPTTRRPWIVVTRKRASATGSASAPISP